MANFHGIIDAIRRFLQPGNTTDNVAKQYQVDDILPSQMQFMFCTASLHNMCV